MKRWLGERFADFARPREAAAAAPINGSHGWEVQDLRPMADAEDLPAVAAPRRKRRPDMQDYLYRVSWRFDGWAPGYWRTRYCRYEYARQIVTRVDTRGGECKVARTAAPVADVPWVDVAMQPRAAAS